jgi:hypothetical protein
MAGAGGKGVTTLTVSLPSLIEELKNHVSADKAPQLDRLVAQARDSPSEHAQIKRQMGELATADQLRAAVNALIDKCAAAPVPAPAASGNSTAEAACSSTSTSGSSLSGLPPELRALFGDVSEEDFRARLIHAFHCRAPSCPVPGCVGMSFKLDRLHAHVSGCSGENCVLCRMWTYLKYYRSSMDGAGSGSAPMSLWGTGGLCQTLYVEPLLQSSQLLPRLKDGQISWIPPRDALAQLRELTAVPNTMAAAEGRAPDSLGMASAKRQKCEFRAGAPGASIGYRGGDAFELPPPPPPPWGRLVGDARMGTAGTPGPAASTAEFKDPLAALEQQLAEAHSRLGGVPLAASTSLQSLQGFAQSFLPGVPLGFSSSSNMNLESMLKCTSLTDLGLKCALAPPPQPSRHL